MGTLITKNKAKDIFLQGFAGYLPWGYAMSS
jgi:hypothetical protein